MCYEDPSVLRRRYVHQSAGGPQIRYKLAAAKKICDPKGVPVDVIPMVDYGTMNGKKVMEFALKLAESKK